VSDANTKRDAIELVIEGADKTVAGFVRGLFIGARSTDWPVVSAEHGVETETLAETLKGWVGLSDPLAHVIVTTAGFELVKQALADPRCAGLELRQAQVVTGASFEFRFEVFSEEAAAVVRATFSRLPPGVVLEDYAEKEKRHGAEAEGVELYSSVHHYTFSGKGRVRGPFRATLYVHEQARRVEQIKEGVLTLHRGELLPV